VRLLLIVLSILSLGSLRGSLLRDSSVESARCGSQAGGSTVQSAVAVDGEMRNRSWAGYMAVTSLVGGLMLADSTADRSLLMLQLASPSWGCGWLVLPDVPSSWCRRWMISGWKRGLFIQTCRGSTCPADLVGVASRMNTRVEVPWWEAALGLELWVETGVIERESVCVVLYGGELDRELQCGCPHNWYTNKHKHNFCVY